MATGIRQLQAVTFEAAGLGDRSYLVHDGHVGAVVDPQRDPGLYLSAAAALGVEITLVLETHVHNDYLSGGLALARRTGARYGIPAGEQVGFAAECDALDEGDVLRVGELTVRAMATPGHTPHHLSYLVEGGPGAGVVLTGGSLLAGATGRTDLFGAGQTLKLAEAQWGSVRRLLAELAPATAVLPTHGFGSFCSVGPTSPTEGDLTVEGQRLVNPAALLDLALFVRSLVAEPLPVPTYYRYMAPLNRAGVAEPAGGAVDEVSPGSLAELLGAGPAVVDLRPRRVFADAHWRGALNIELGPHLPTYLGWVIPYDAPLVVISHDAEAVAQARRLLATIGREALAGWARDQFATSGAQPPMGHYAVAGFRELAGRMEDGPRPSVVDVRFAHEWRTGHILGARNVPLPEVEALADGLDGEGDGEVWVHCAGGYRAAIAASLLSGRGLRPVLIDDGFDNAVAAGLKVVTG